MNNRKVSKGLLIGSMAIAIAWQVESITCGRCFISTYLAPLAFLGLFASILLWKGNGEEEPNKLIVGIHRHGVLLILVGAVVLLVPLFLTRRYGSAESSAVGAVAVITGTALINIHRALSSVIKQKEKSENKNG